MIHLFLLLVPLLGCCRTAPQQQAAAEEKKVKFEATARETPAKEKNPPGFLCEGATDLPEDCRIDIEIYFGKPITGSQLHHAAEPVKGGKFSTAFVLFPKSPKNLAGAYTVRVKFNPHLQPDRFAALPAIVRDLPLNVGKPEEAAQERRAWGERLVEKMKGLSALSEEAQAKFREGKLNNAGWDAQIKEWERRAHEINESVIDIPEYHVLGYGRLIADGFEKISGITLDLCRFYQRGDEKNMRDGRERLRVILSNYEDYLLGRPLDPKKEMLKLAEKASEFLEAAVTATDDRGPLGRKMFRQAMLDLHRLVSPGPRQTILEISASVNELFDALDAKQDVTTFHGKIKARLADLKTALQDEK
jgi:hypothetical protein